MLGVLQGFAAIAIIIGLGWLLAHLRVLDMTTQAVLAKLSFYVATPALMVTVLSRADVAQVFSRSLLATALGVAVAGGIALALARLVWRHDLGDTVVTMLSSAYVNAGNLGIPIASYVLGDAAFVAPTLLLQLLLLQPLALTVLDHATGRKGFSVRRALTRPFVNPLTIGSIIGLMLSITHTQLPSLVADPLALVAGMAVPGMLLAYGISLRLGPKFGAGAGSEIGVLSVLKLVVQPLAAYLAGRFAFGLDDTALLAVTTLSALPTAQNIFIIASRYERGTVVARDTIFVTTLLCIPVLLAIVALVT